MTKPALIAICTVLMIGGTIFDGTAAPIPKMTCSGSLIITRADGVTLGQCDLNFLPVKQMIEIEKLAEYPAALTRRLKINVEYER
jgi:hypothetical protein